MATKGITQIKIPIRVSELTIEAVEPYLDTIFAQFEENARKIRADYDHYCLDHPILAKVRPHDDDSDINNVVLVPDLKAMVDWSQEGTTLILKQNHLMNCIKEIVILVQKFYLHMVAISRCLIFSTQHM